MLDSPRIVNCFEAMVLRNPEYRKRTQITIKVELLLKEQVADRGKEVRLRLR